MSKDAQAPPAKNRVRGFSLPELGGAAGSAPGGQAGQAGQDPAHPVEEGGFIPIYLQEKSENPLETAQRQADQLLASAQGQAAGIRQGAQEEGYQAGYQTGLEEGTVASRARIEAACDNLGRALAALERARHGVLLVMEEEIVSLVQATTDRILLAPGAVDPDLIRRVVRQAIERVSQVERLTVRLNADDLERVREFRPKLLEGMSRLKYLDLTSDTALRPGDCLVEGPQSQVDATLATRRQKIFKLLEETFHQSPRLDLQAALDEALEEALASEPPAALTPPAAAPPALENTPPMAASQAADPLPQSLDLEDW